MPRIARAVAVGFPENWKTFIRRRKDKIKAVVEEKIEGIHICFS
jgi:hypothetical protein